MKYWKLRKQIQNMQFNQNLFGFFALRTREKKRSSSWRRKKELSNDDSYESAISIDRRFHGIISRNYNLSNVVTVSISLKLNLFHIDIDPFHYEYNACMHQCLKRYAFAHVFVRKLIVLLMMMKQNVHESQVINDE